MSLKTRVNHFPEERPGDALLVAQMLFTYTTNDFFDMREITALDGAAQDEMEGRQITNREAELQERKSRENSAHGSAKKQARMESSMGGCRSTCTSSRRLPTMRVELALPLPPSCNGGR